MKMSSVMTGIATGAIAGAVVAAVANNMQHQSMIPHSVKRKAHKAQRVVKHAAHDMSDILS